MFTKERSFFSILKTLNYLNVSLLLVFGFACLKLGVIYFSYEKEMLSVTNPSSPSIKQIKWCDYEKIGEGALKITSSLKSFPLPDLKREMRFFGKNTRPDATIYDLLIHVGFRKSGQSLKVVSGQKLYLAYAVEEKPYLHFSSIPTPLWMTPHLSENGKTFVELGVRLKTDHEDVIEEKKTFEIENLLIKDAPKVKDGQFEQAMETLKRGKWWDPDQFHKIYGGKAFNDCKNRERVELFCNEKSDVIPVNEGDSLIWKESKWLPIRVGKASKGYPLARLKKLTPHRMEWETWSSDGFETAEIKFEKEKATPLNFRIEEVFSRIRQRTKSRISCRINGKSTILKKGDWILKTSTGWKVLKSLQEIDDALSCRSKGELFVFDGVDKKNGKGIFSGTLFDSMHTQKQIVKIPLIQQKNEEHSSHKKKAFSSKIHKSEENLEIQESEKAFDEVRREIHKRIKKQEEQEIEEK